MASVVICDDDSLLRKTVSTLCEDAGLHVVAETDNGTDVLEIVRRFDVDVLVLDLSMGDTSGERTLEALQDLEHSPIVIVFTAYAADPTELIRLGAREVVEKPDLQQLATVLQRLADASAANDASSAGDDRRRTSRAVEQLPELWRSPSGISSATDLAVALRCTAEGDAVLLIVLRGIDALPAEVGRNLAADCHLAAARLLRETLRTQDSVHEVPEVDGFVGVVRGGDGRAAEAAWARLVTLTEAAGVPGHLIGTHARIQLTGGQDALTRAIAVLRSAGPDVRALISA